MSDEWDVVVVGGGPGGMMAAGRAAQVLREKGVKPRVLLLEKNNSLGQKLLITGGGRSNITNAEFDTRKLLSKFKESDQFLFSAFSRWDAGSTLDFFHKRGMETKEEALGRVFPASNKAQSVLETLVRYMKESGVEVHTNAAVAQLVAENGNITAIRLKNNHRPGRDPAKSGGKEIFAKAVILATGGLSHPETGSTGDGFTWLKELGHTVVPPSTALVPITTGDIWSHKISGVSLQNVKITLFQNGQKQYTSVGKLLFTHQGLSGPGILNASSEIGELLKYGEVVLEIDLVPHLSYDTLNFKLQEIFKTHHTKKLKNALPDLIPGGLVETLAELGGVNIETPCNSVSRDDRLKLVKLLKHIPTHPTGLLGVDKAIITSGGVALGEVDFKTMQSRKYKNLYIVGDLLNIDRPSGGYSLQLCWTTGHVAGTAAAEAALSPTR